MTLLLLILGCSKPAAEAPQSAPSEQKDGAPVTFTIERGKHVSQVSVRFSHPAEDVRIEAWGVGGLTVAGERERWAGSVVDGTEIHLEVAHAGGGDLALRAVGVFRGNRLDEVRSFTIGDREPTPVPTDGRGSKGWDATRR